MEIFKGTRGYIHCKKSGAPMELYWNWLREVWIADLRVLVWCLVFLPILPIHLLFYFGLAITEFVLDFWPIPYDNRKKQTDAAQEYHAWLRERGLIHTLRNPRRKMKNK